jgi:hypothetical protein
MDTDAASEGVVHCTGKVAKPFVLLSWKISERVRWMYASNLPTPVTGILYSGRVTLTRPTEEAITFNRFPLFGCSDVGSIPIARSRIVGSKSQIRSDVNSPIRHSFQETLARLRQGRRSYIHTIKEGLKRSKSGTARNSCRFTQYHTAPNPCDRPVRLHLILAKTSDPDFLSTAPCK